MTERQLTPEELETYNQGLAQARQRKWEHLTQLHQEGHTPEPGIPAQIEVAPDEHQTPAEPT